jgi:hypothetical protein
MPQTNYTLYIDPGQEGMIASADTILRSGAVGTYTECVNSTDAYIPYGRVVVGKPGGKIGEVQLPTAAAATQKPLGLTYIMNYEQGLNGEIGIPPRHPLGFVYEGIVWLRTETAVTADAPVFYRFAAGAGGTELGRVRGTAEAGSTDTLPRAKFVRAAAAGQLVPVRVDIDLV